MRQGWQDDILSFWFDELTPEDWYSGKSDVDDRIRTRFGPLYEEMKRGLEPSAVKDQRTALAAVIALDQFPRNLFRGQAAAFATDNLAIDIARHAVEAQLDHGLTDDQKQFLYMPFMHSEISADQERCVDLFRSIDNADSLKYAIEHRDIIQQFGRFPHRNKALGRETSGAERRFMEGHAGFGQ